MRPRGCGCFSTLVILVLLLVICVGLGWFVGVPRLRDNVANSIEHGIGTEVAGQFAGLDVPAGEYTVDLDAIARQLHGQVANGGIEGITLRGQGGDRGHQERSGGRERDRGEGGGTAEHVST